MSLVFTHPATAEIYTLSLHDALPISESADHALARPAALTPHVRQAVRHRLQERRGTDRLADEGRLVPARFEVHQRLDRKSTRLNSSHSQISYAVFCLKKKTLARSPAV